MFRTTCYLVAIVALASSNVRAQSVEDEGWWGAVLSQGDIKSEFGQPTRWKWWFDGHLRFQDEADGFNVSIVRPGIGYKLTDTATAWAGYGWIRTSPFGGAPDFDESRIWQQITWSAKSDPVNFGFRSRLEQRFLETSDDTGWRFRQFVSARTPLAGTDRLTFVLWDEAFFHLNDTDFGAAAGFDQNRAFVGFGWKWDLNDPKSRVEIGYLNQFIDSSTGINQMNHILAVNFFLQ